MRNSASEGRVTDAISVWKRRSAWREDPQKRPVLRPAPASSRVSSTFIVRVGRLSNGDHEVKVSRTALSSFRSSKPTHPPSNSKQESLSSPPVHSYFQIQRANSIIPVHLQIEARTSPATSPTLPAPNQLRLHPRAPWQRQHRHRPAPAWTR
jgi:hypothetical protein